MADFLDSEAETDVSENKANANVSNAVGSVKHFDLIEITPVGDRTMLN